MGLNFRKSIKVGPARINLSKSGVGYSIGAGGLRYTKSPKRKSSGKKSVSKKKATATTKLRSASTYSGSSHAERKPIERSWTMAIILSIICIIVVGGGSFIVTFLCYLIASIFVKNLEAAIGAKILVIGIPAVLAITSAVFAFNAYKPLKEESLNIE